MERYFKIGEISRLYGIGVDSLRYYEKLGLIHPARSESGYRLYSIRDIWCLNVIRDLRGLDFSMEQIAAYLDHRTVDSTLDLLSQESQAIGEKMAFLEKLQANVNQRLQAIRNAADQPVDQFSCARFPARPCYAIEEGYAANNDAEMDILIKRLLNCDPQRLYIIGNSQIGSVLPLAQAQAGDFSRYSAAFLLTPQGDKQLPAGRYLSVRYRGSYRQTARYVPALFQYAAQQGLAPTGDILEFLRIDIHTSADPEEYITELQVRVAD